MVIANEITNSLITILGIINLGWLGEMTINGFVQDKELNRWVGSWKAPLFITIVLAVLSLGVSYVESWKLYAYFGAGLLLTIQTLFMLDYYKSLSAKIDESWYVASTIVSMFISIVTLINISLFMVTTLGITDYY